MTGERRVEVAAGSGTLHVALLGGFSVRVGEPRGCWLVAAAQVQDAG